MSRVHWIALAAVAVLAGGGSAEPQPGPARTVTASLRDLPLRRALEVLFQGSGQQYEVRPAVPDVPVTLALRDVPLEQAARALAHATSRQVPGLAVWQERAGGPFIFGVRPVDSTVAAAATSGGDTVLRLDLRSVPLRRALDQLLSPGEFDIEANVPDVPITLRLTAARPVAVRAIIRTAAGAATGIAMTQSGDHFHIYLRRPVGTDAARPQTVDAGDGTVWEKIPIRYQDVAYVMQLLGGSMLPGRGPRVTIPGARAGASPNGTAVTLPRPVGIRDLYGVGPGNSVLARGTPEDVAQLRKVLGVVDVPQRQLRVRVEAGTVSAEGQVLEGSVLKLTDTSASDKILLNITPLVNGDGTVTLALEGGLRAGGLQRPIKTRVQVAPGRKTEIMTVGDGARAVTLRIRADIMPPVSAVTPLPKR